MALSVRTANNTRPARILIYGVEGVGKSTLGAKADKPIFITPEGGIDQLTDADGKPSQEIAGIKTWEDLLSAITMVGQSGQWKTIVIDSLDWAEKLAHASIIGNSGKSITTVDGGYGSGYRKAEQMFRAFIDRLSALRDEKGMNVILTAHATVREVKDPGMVDNYDAFEIKCHEMVSSLVREWVDALLFVRFRTYTKTNDDKQVRALGDGSRVCYTIKQPAFQAKNRYGLPAELPFDLDFWKNFSAFIKSRTPAQLQVSTVADLKISIQESFAKLTDDVTRNAVKKSIDEAGETLEQLTLIDTRLKTLVAGL